MSYLQDDNALLEIKHKELNDTVQSLLQSREQFVNAYQVFVDRLSFLITLSFALKFAIYCMKEYAINCRLTLE